LERKRAPIATQENLEYHRPGNFSDEDRGGRNSGARGGPQVQFNNSQGQDNSKEIVHGKQQAPQATTQESKRQKKSIKDLASDCENSDSEYLEYEYQARPEELRLPVGTRVEIAAEEEDKWDSVSIYGRTAGDLETRSQKSDGRYIKVQDRPGKKYQTSRGPPARDRDRRTRRPAGGCFKFQVSSYRNSLPVRRLRVCHRDS
jgi:hypothetical protein